MQTQRLEGWLFDIDELGSEVAISVYSDDGRLVRITEEFQQPVYAQGERAKLKELASRLYRRGIISGVRWEERAEFWSGRQIEVLELHVADASVMPQLRKAAAALDRELTFYNLDIPMGQHYLYLRRLFPLCRLACEVDQSLNIIEIAATESPWKAEYQMPDLRRMNMRGHRMQPLGDESRIILECEGDEREIKLREGEKAVTEFNEFIEARDPDILLSERGDSILLPSLLRLAESLKMRLSLDRHNIVTKRKIETEGRTYFSYGRIIYKGPSYPLFGRWHIDSRNSFIYRETDLDGLLELSRVAKVPVQRMARTSPGSAMTSMEMEMAISNRILVPWHKSEPEKYKTALELLTVDKGGLVFQPPVGGHEDVAEIDFASMYPAIMVRHNISPETVLCQCCENRAVPEAGYNICEKRRGLVPRTLEPLLERRRVYKRLMKHSADAKERDLYDSRQTAIKWMLVSCLDGATRVLYQQYRRWKIAPIREVVEPYFPDGQWGMQSVEGLAVPGIDDDLRNSMKSVTHVIKVPAPPEMIQVKLRLGRSLLLTPDHQCYVLQDGCLRIKRADQLEDGDWIPMAASLEDVSDGQVMSHIDLIQMLQQNLSLEEQKVWRVFGNPVQRMVQKNYRNITDQAKASYTAKSIWNWREYGYLPLAYVDAEDFTAVDRKHLKLGRGKRTGGVIKRIPALIEADEELGFLLGFFVGDGSASGSTIRFDVGANEREHATRLRNIIRRKFGLQSRLYREQKAQTYVLQINSVALIQIFRIAIGLEGSAERGKLQVPDVVLNGPRACQRGFILGLIASDGSVSRVRNYACIDSASPEFIKEVGLLLSLIGIGYRLTDNDHLCGIQTRNLEETRKVIYDGAPISRKHLRSWKHRQEVARTARSSDIPSEASGLLTLSREMRMTRAPRVSCVEMVSRKTAQVKLQQILQKAHLLCDRSLDQLHELKRLVQSSLNFTRVTSVEAVPSADQFVYCFKLADEPPAFFVDGGVLTHNCFGYLGYRNARFGRIEAHEAVTAFGRDKLLRAKELAEAAGFRVMHAITDSLWIKREGATRSDVLALCDEITQECEVEMSLEGIYRWIIFLSSKEKEARSVPARYYGVFSDGEVKARGLAFRRADTPRFIREAQLEMLAIVSKARTLAERKILAEEARRVFIERMAQVESGEVDPQTLVLRRTLTKEIDQYTVETRTAVAARQLRSAGVRLHPGERAEYVITDARSKDKSRRVQAAVTGADLTYDAEEYAKLLKNAADEVLG
jgi:DNA polymerase elongation subunit (family B)